MEETVKGGTEGNVPVESSSTEQTTAIDTPSDSGSNNEASPTSAQDNDIVSEAQDEVKSERGQNRVQELANEMRASKQREKELEDQIAELQGRKQQVDQQYMQQTQQPQPQFQQPAMQVDPAIQYLAQRQQISEQEMRLFKRQQMLVDYERLYPDVAANPIMDGYVANGLKADTNASIHDLAKEARDLFQRASAESQRDTEERVLTRELVGSDQGGKSTDVYVASDDELESARKAWKSASSPADRQNKLRSYMSLQKQRELGVGE